MYRLSLLPRLCGEAGSAPKYSLMVSSKSLYTMFCLYTIVKAVSRASPVVFIAVVSVVVRTPVVGDGRAYTWMPKSVDWIISLRFELYRARPGLPNVYDCETLGGVPICLGELVCFGDRANVY